MCCIASLYFSRQTTYSLVLFGRFQYAINMHRALTHTRPSECTLCGWHRDDILYLLSYIPLHPLSFSFFYLCLFLISPPTFSLHLTLWLFTPASPSASPLATGVCVCVWRQKWTKLWVVLHCEISPITSFLGYCKKENKWLLDNQAVVRYPLHTVTLSKVNTKKHENVLQLEFASQTVQVCFDSMTKMDHYYQLLQGVTGEREREGERGGRG